MNEQQRQIVDIWVTLPSKLRLDLYKALGAGINEDADRLSAGRSETIEGYDLLINGPKPDVVHTEEKIMDSGTHIKTETGPETKPE